jgi:hypothetical protein
MIRLNGMLPVQIYLWADSPERAFVERTSAAIWCCSPSCW